MRYLYIGKGSVAIGSHCNINVNAILGITGNSGISRTVDGAVEGIVGDSLVFITSMSLTLKLKRYSQVLKMLIVQ